MPARGGSAFGGKIFLGTDHAGFEMKESLKTYLTKELGYEVEDMGNAVYDEQDDYPDFIRQVADAVAENPEQNRGIILGASGQGEAMTANRFKGVRAALVYSCNEAIVQLSREHNNANVLSLGARFLTDWEVKHLVKIWLETKFTNEERHKRRISKIDNL